MILAVFFLQEKLRVIQVFGITLSFVGVICLSGSPSSSSWLALVLLIISALGWAITNTHEIFHFTKNAKRIF